MDFWVKKTFNPNVLAIIVLIIWVKLNDVSIFVFLKKIRGTPSISKKN